MRSHSTANGGSGCHSAKGTEALNRVLALRMQALAAKARSLEALGEEELKTLSASEREELMLKVRKARTTTSSTCNEHHPKFLRELDAPDARKLTDALELHADLPIMTIECHPDKTRPAASVVLPSRLPNLKSRISAVLLN